jgi:hypothetical protein
MKHYILELLISEVAEGYDEFWIILKNKNLVPEKVKKELISCWLKDNIPNEKNNISYSIIDVDYDNNTFKIKLDVESSINNILDNIINTTQDSVIEAETNKISWEEIKEFGFMDVNSTYKTLQYTAKMSLIKYECTE